MYMGLYIWIFEKMYILLEKYNIKTELRKKLSSFITFK